NGAATIVGVSSIVSSPPAPTRVPYANIPIAVNAPVAIPATAPGAVVPRHQITRKNTGVIADPARANAQVTMVAIIDGSTAPSASGLTPSATPAESTATITTAARPASTA